VIAAGGSACSARAGAERLLLLAALLAGLAGCTRAKDRALQALESRQPQQRAEAARQLGELARPDDDLAWALLERATRDPDRSVRLAAVEALLHAPKVHEGKPDERAAVADDALSAVLSDHDEALRLAAAKVLGQRCGERPIAYLEGAFQRSGALGRPVIAEALGQCGLGLDKLLAHTEEVRRARAQERLGGSSSGLRVWAARELGLLGRPDDVAALEKLLDDRDGAVVAAAVAGLGQASARRAAPHLAALVADPVPLLAAAAARALVDLGPEVTRAALPQLARQAVAAGEQGPAAAAALATVADPPRLCSLAREAREPAAAAVLARGCPPGPLAEALGRAVPKARRLAPEDEQRVRALTEALLQARPEPLPEAGVAALERLLPLRDPLWSARAAELAGLLGAKRLGPQLLELIHRERLVRVKTLGTVQRPAAAQASAPPPPEAVRAPPTPDQQKLARLMKLLEERSGKERARQGARERLAALLRGPRLPPGEQLVLPAAMRALRRLQTPGAEAELLLLANDPDPVVAAAALPPAPPRPEEPPAAAPEGCAGQQWTAAPPEAACLQALVAEGKPPAPDRLPALRAALWSDSGADRAAACVLLSAPVDAATAPLRAALAQDPEGRVRSACAAKKETAPPGPR
jgi:HEAT repeat protein